MWILHGEIGERLGFGGKHGESGFAGGRGQNNLYRGQGGTRSASESRIVEKSVEGSNERGIKRCRVE